MKKKKEKKNLSRSQRPPRLYERPPGGGTAPVEKPWYREYTGVNLRYGMDFEVTVWPVWPVDHTKEAMT